MPADDLVEAEATASQLGGIENHPFGAILIRLVRQARQVRTALRDLDERLKALEGP